MRYNPILFSSLILTAQGFVVQRNHQRFPVLFAEEAEEFVDPVVGDESTSEVFEDEEDNTNLLNIQEESDDDAPSDVEIAESSFEMGTNEMESIDDVSTGDALIKLLQIGASTGRGEFATESQKKQAAELISVLEKENPSEEAAKSSLMNGRWELLYSSTQLFRSSPFFMAGRAVCSTPEQAEQYDWFCDMHRKALAISTIGQVRQVVSDTRLVSEFEVSVGAVPFLSDFTPFRYSGGLPVTIEGAIVSSADITPTSDGKGWELLMDTVEIKGSNIPGLRQILDQGLKLESRDLGSFLESNVESYENPRPVFETTYLSKDIRISRDQDGKVFVYGKLDDATTPSSYDAVEADLGLLKLLGGFNDAITKLYL